MRPDKQDRAALRILLQREDLSDYDAEFVENIRNRLGDWTHRQAAYFDTIWAKYY